MYLKGIENCAEKLPQTLREWRTLDDVLQDEYMEQINWFLDAFDEQREVAVEKGSLSIVLRLFHARTQVIEALADWVRGR